MVKYKRYDHVILMLELCPTLTIFSKQTVYVNQLVLNISNSRLSTANAKVDGLNAAQQNIPLYCQNKTTQLHSTYDEDE